MKTINQVGMVILYLSLISIFALLPLEIKGCNEAVCASVVSKCMLTQSCKCELSNCSCCKECFSCLSYLYDECCSCVDMCPEKNETHSLSTKSHVEDFPEPIPELFNSLTVDLDDKNRWISETFAVEVDTSPYLPKHDPNESNRVKNIIAVNCTVVFMTECMPWNKCKESCRATGASKYRWFHDGCCQCVGHTCINYGSDKSRPCSWGREESIEAKEFYYDEETHANVQHIAETSHMLD